MDIYIERRLEVLYANQFYDIFIHMMPISFIYLYLTSTWGSDK